MEYDLRNKKVLITGATGFIGSNTAKKLLDTEAEIRILARSPKKAKMFDKGNIEIVIGDMTDHDSLRKAVKGCNVVIHVAGALGLANKKTSYAVNVEGTRVLGEASSEEGIERFFHISSIWTFGIDASGIVNEKSTRHPSGYFYSDTKYEGENLLVDMYEKRNLPLVTIYPSIVYGPNDPNWTIGIIKAIQKNSGALPNGGSGLLHLIYIDDLVDGILGAISNGVPGEGYMLSGPEVVTVKDFSYACAKMLGVRKLPSFPGWLGLAIGWAVSRTAWFFGKMPEYTDESIRGLMMEAEYDNSKARNDLGFQPKVDFAEGMKRVESWYKTYQGITSK